MGAVYGDREHSANLLFLTGFDPRFEEALLLLGPGKRRVLLVGNEGIVHAVVAGLPLEIELFQGFSLMGQPRESTPHLDRVLDGVGLGSAGQVGVVGWKYLTAAESDDPSRPAWAPAVIVESLRRVTGTAPIEVTAVLMDPGEGLRSRNGADQIAAFAWAALRVSQAVFRVVRGTRPGMTERDVAARWATPANHSPCIPSSPAAHPASRSTGCDRRAVGRSPSATASAAASATGDRSAAAPDSSRTPRASTSSPTTSGPTFWRRRPGTPRSGLA